MSAKSSFTITILIFISTSMCGTNSFTTASKPKVVATASMIADMIKNIAGDHVEIKTIVPIGGDPHIYEATPRDAQMVADADLIFRNGLTFEGWLNELIANAGSKADVITVTDGLAPISSLIYQNATDPHAWMDARNGLQYIENIKNTLVAFDSSNRASYETNYIHYRSKLLEADGYIEERISTIPENKRILITSHDAFQYFGRRYGLRLESILGTSTDADIQTSDIVRINRVIRESQVPALFVESTINPKVLEQLARDNDVVIGGKLYADSIGDEDSPAPSYIEMLTHNTDVIVAGLMRDSSIQNDLTEGTSGNKTLIYVSLTGVLFLLFGILIYKFNR
ncbi:MAG: zinc ABC transporter solute-binding protein [Saprospiraceae bacterium]|nr:zinc ABC transporter solute-binding protein [Saprospiraceae bacterium]